MSSIKPNEHVVPVLRRIFHLKIQSRLPSWNTVLALSQWQRIKFKNRIAQDFLFALQACAKDSSMKITCAQSTMSIYAATLAHYLATRRGIAKSKRHSARQAKAKRNTPK